MKTRLTGPLATTSKGLVLLGFSDRLKSLIGDSSVSRFAKRCGIGESLLRSYLAGACPGTDKFSVIANTCGVSMDWLATGKEPLPASREETPPAGQENQALKFALALQDELRKVLPTNAATAAILRAAKAASS
jgi:hypothetical protein